MGLSIDMNLVGDGLFLFIAGMHCTNRILKYTCPPSNGFDLYLSLVVRFSIGQKEYINKYIWLSHFDGKTDVWKACSCCVTIIYIGMQIACLPARSEGDGIFGDRDIRR